jgi:hypothetical protein
MALIRALRQMFNLAFHTDHHRRVVRVEPADALFSAGAAQGATVDWRGKIDTGKPVVVEEPGTDLARRMVWCYRGGDGAVARFNRAGGAGGPDGAGGELGSWTATVESTAAADEASVWENPLFTPSLNTPGYYYGAPSALIVQAGGVGADTVDRTENLNFLPKIVRYEGVQPLPAGERWGWPASESLPGGGYPKLAFHAPESGYTLCFEDRDGCTGLHTHRDRDIRLWNRSRRLTAWITLSAAEVSTLSFFALYLLSIDGEECLCRLEQVVDYSPSAASTKCVFIKHIP